MTKTVTSDPEGNITVETEYDTKGRISGVSNPQRGIPMDWTTNTYDALDRKTRVDYPNGSAVQFSYQGNKTTNTDAAGKQRRSTTNVFGYLTKLEENPSFGSPQITTNYKYYAFGPMYQVEISGQQRRFTHDWLGRMTQQELPESGITNFQYNDDGLLTTRTDARWADWVNAHVQVIDQNGTRISYTNLLADEARRVATNSMTSGQFMDLLILHELAHSFGGGHAKDEATFYQRNIWNNCFK